MSQQRELDVTKRDRFELLSAYLDGEVSPDERRLVMTWLSSDPNVQCLYRRLLQLRQGCQDLRQTPITDSQAECTATAVVRRLNYRFRITCMAGLTAATIAFIGTVSGALKGPSENLAVVEQPDVSSAEAANENLELALDQPPIQIPKSAVSAQATPMQESNTP